MSNRSSRPVCRLSFVATALLCALHALATSVSAQAAVTRPPIMTAALPKPELHMHLLEHDVVTHATRGEISPDGKRVVYVKVVEADSKFGPAGIVSKDLKSGEIAQVIRLEAQNRLASDK